MKKRPIIIFSVVAFLGAGLAIASSIKSGVINLATSNILGVLGVSNGGTSQSTYATGDTLYASASNTLSKLSAGSNGDLYELASGVPSWSSTISTAKTFSGNVTVQGIADFTTTNTQPSGTTNTFGTYIYNTSSTGWLDVLTSSTGGASFGARVYNNGTYNQWMSVTSPGSATLGNTAAIGNTGYAGNPIVGRTDGSGASSGYVGQVITFNGVSTTNPSSGWQASTIVASLPAGVWLLLANITLAPSGGQNNATVMLSTSNTPGGGTNVIQPLADGVQFYQGATGTTTNLALPASIRITGTGGDSLYLQSEGNTGVQVFVAGVAVRLI